MSVCCGPVLLTGFPHRSRAPVSVERSAVFLLIRLFGAADPIVAFDAAGKEFQRLGDPLDIFSRKPADPGKMVTPSGRAFFPVRSAPEVLPEHSRGGREKVPAALRL